MNVSFCVCQQKHRCQDLHFFLCDDTLALVGCCSGVFKSQDKTNLCFPLLKANLWAIGTNEHFLEDEYELSREVVVSHSFELFKKHLDKVLGK